jgi:hypothetical protein
MHQNPPLDPAFVIRIRDRRSDRLQLNQHFALSDAQIHWLNGWYAGLLVVVASCYVFALSGCGFGVKGSAAADTISSVGDHQRCHIGRDHLLHDQRRDANHVLDQVHRGHHGQLDGDHRGDGRRYGLYQQRSGYGCLHHRFRVAWFRVAHADVQRGARDLHNGADGDPQ